MKLAFLGDISFNGSFDIVNNPDLKNGLADVAGYLSKFDIVIANLESPFTLDWNKGPAKSAYLGAHPENAVILKILNISMCNLANNHIMDYGEEGLNTTMEILDNWGIKYFGHSSQNKIIKGETNLLSLNGYCCYSSNPGYYPKLGKMDDYGGGGGVTS